MPPTLPTPTVPTRRRRASCWRWPIRPATTTAACSPSAPTAGCGRAPATADVASATGGALPPVEIWALGLRNPWRFSFDRLTGEIWIGDVGQNAWEEIDVADSKRPAPLHFGWRTMEGFHCYDPKKGCKADAGRYLFSDYCTGVVWSLLRDANGKATVSTLLQSKVAVSSFGEDEAGELYLCDHGGGKVLRLEARAQ